MNARHSTPRPGGTSINLVGIGHLLLGTVVFALGFGLSGLSLLFLPGAGSGGWLVPSRELVMAALGIGILVMIIGGIEFSGAIGLFWRTRRGWIIGIVFGVLHALYGSILAAWTLFGLVQCVSNALEYSQDPAGVILPITLMAIAGLSPFVIGVSSVLVLQPRFEEFQ